MQSLISHHQAKVTGPQSNSHLSLPAWAVRLFVRYNQSEWRAEGRRHRGARNPITQKACGARSSDSGILACCSKPQLAKDWCSGGKRQGESMASCMVYAMLPWVYRLDSCCYFCDWNERVTHLLALPTTGGQYFLFECDIEAQNWANYFEHQKYRTASSRLSLAQRVLSCSCVLVTQLWVPFEDWQVPLGRKMATEEILIPAGSRYIGQGHLQHTGGQWPAIMIVLHYLSET